MKYCLCILGVLMHLYLGGQTFQYRYYQGDALPFQQVNCMSHAADGSLWLGTDSGLYRFNGDSYLPANLQLKSRHIRGFAQWTLDSLLFINDRGLHLLTTHSNSPQTRLLLDETRLHYPSSLFLDRQGRTWIGQENGQLLRYDPKDRLEKEYSFPEDGGEGTFLMEEDADGRLWLLRPGASLLQYDENRGKWIPKEAMGQPQHMAVSQKLLYTLEEGLLRQWKLNSGDPVLVRSIRIPGDVDQVYARGNSPVFLASDSEIYWLVHSGPEWHIEQLYGSNDPHRVELLPFDGIQRLHYSPETGTPSNPHLWIGTTSGFGLLWKGYFQSVRGMAHDNVLGIHSPSEGKVRISLGSLYQVDSSGFQEREFEDVISSISGNAGITFLGTNSGHIYRIQEGILERTFDFSDRGGGIFFMLTESDGATWFCQAPSEKPLRGLARLEPNGRLKAYQEEEGLQSRILVVRRGGRDELYAAGIGPDTYLYKYDPSSDRFRNVSGKLPFTPSTNFEVHDMAVDSMGVVWLGTTDGLLKFDGERVRRIDLGPYTSREIRAVYKGEEGGVWTATDTEGLLYVLEGAVPVRFGEQAGLPSRIASYRALTMDPAGILWMGTAEGAVFSVDPYPGPLRSRPPFVHSIRKDGLEIPPAFPLESRVNASLEVMVDAFGYPGEQLAYQYRHYPSDITPEEVQDYPWTDVTGTAIPVETTIKGHLVYQYRARLGEGYQWSEPASFEVRILAPWYQTPLAVGLLIVLGIVLIGWLVHRGSRMKVRDLQEELALRETELSSQQVRLEKQQKEARSTQTHMYMLQRLVRQMPDGSTWEEVWPVLQRLVNLPLGISRIDLYFRVDDNLMSREVRSDSPEASLGTIEFNEKENLASYVLSTGLPLHIENLGNPALWPVQQGDPTSGAAYLIPFTHQGRGMVFAAYAPVAGTLSSEDRIILQLLVSFLSRTVSDAIH